MCLMSLILHKLNFSNISLLLYGKYCTCASWNPQTKDKKYVSVLQSHIVANSRWLRKDLKFAGCLLRLTHVVQIPIIDCSRDTLFLADCLHKPSSTSARINIQCNCMRMNHYIIFWISLYGTSFALTVITFVHKHLYIYSVRTQQQVDVIKHAHPLQKYFVQLRRASLAWSFFLQTKGIIASIGSSDFPTK